MSYPNLAQSALTRAIYAAMLASGLSACGLDFGSNSGNDNPPATPPAATGQAELKAAVKDGASFTAADTNADGSLNFDEAKAKAANLNQAGFDSLDSNKDGKLSKAELGIQDTSITLTDSQILFYYKRANNDYGDCSVAGGYWGLHLWDDAAPANELADDKGYDKWAAPLCYSGIDPVNGAYYIIDLKGKFSDLTSFRWIMHKGDEKDFNDNRTFVKADLAQVVYLGQGAEKLSLQPLTDVTLPSKNAHFIAQDALIWKKSNGTPASLKLYYASQAGIQATKGSTEVTGADGSIALTEDASVFTQALQAKLPYLKNWAAQAYKLADTSKTESLLKAELRLVSFDADGKVLDVSRVQTAPLVDSLYATDEPLGLLINDNQTDFKLWAPTAQSVKLKIYDANKAEITSKDLTANAKGVWSFSTTENWYGKFYRYEIKVYQPATGKVETNLVSDPYSVSLSTNSSYSQIIDLNDPSLKPDNWDNLAKPALVQPEDIVVYESHIRDFSINDSKVAAEHRGKYLAFTDLDSYGMQHLKQLQQAGLTHFQLLPAFDYATTNEDASQQLNLTSSVTSACTKVTSLEASFCSTFADKTLGEAFKTLASQNPANETTQKVVAALSGYDGFNWGYDPFHYGAPEGGYASNPEGSLRIKEFRTMVQSLNQLGLRVVMDVVYNHTNAAGQSTTSVLDRVVPGYYHRLTVETGDIETATCCSGTASEHQMMEKLMRDTLKTWAVQYKIDGFRFDLMGYHMKDNMVKIKQDLAALTPANDGVDGSKIYLYGEGWNPGDSSGGNNRGISATQINLAGTGIGTFSDRLRDGVRGGGPFDKGAAHLKSQGFISGLFYDPNASNTGSDAEKADLLARADWIRIGLAGNLQNYSLYTRNDKNELGKDIDYGGAPTGYTLDPSEHVVYIDKHDNETLWDILQYKIPANADIATRVRIQNLGQSIVLLSQGIPFIHMGSDLLRSKSMDRDSYDASDWFNLVDFSRQQTAWGIGAPRQDKNADSWTQILEALKNPNSKPAPANIDFASSHFQEMLKIRQSTSLFRLGSEEKIKDLLLFHNTGSSQIPGLIGMEIKGDCDDNTGYQGVVVVFNANDEAQTLEISGATDFSLHPVQKASVDPLVKTSTFTAAVGNDTPGKFWVPARTTAVFVKQACAL